MRAPAVLVAAVALFAPLVLAQPLNLITVGDLPGSNGAWQYGEVTVAAPAAEVQRWFADTTRWQQRFPDVEWVQQLGRTPDGRATIRFRSRIIGRPLTLRLNERPGIITYEGEGHDVTTQGKILIQPLSDGGTHVTLQSASDVHGAAGLFASKKMKRERAEKKFRSDLASTVRLSNAWAAAQRHGG